MTSEEIKKVCKCIDQLYEMIKDASILLDICKIINRPEADYIENKQKV